MRKKRSLAMILIIAMVFCLMPVAVAGRAEAADDSIYCCQASQQCLMYGEGEDGVHYDTSHSLRYAWRCTVIIDSGSKTADVYFEIMDQMCEVPLSESSYAEYLKNYDAEFYEKKKDYINQKMTHMVCSVADYHNDSSDWGYILTNFKWDDKPFYFQPETRGDKEYPVGNYIAIAKKDRANGKIGYGFEDGKAYGPDEVDKRYGSKVPFIQKADIPDEYKNTNEKVDKNYLIGTDNFSFENSGSGFPTVTGISAPSIANFGGKFRSGSYGYMLDVSTYSAMIKGMKPSGISYINTELNREFRGACYGMSATSGLIFEDKIGLNQVGETSATATTYSLKSPKEGNDALLKTILYYQIYGNFERDIFLLNKYGKGQTLSSYIGKAKDLAKTLESNPKTPLIVGITFYDRNMNSYYHAVLAYKAVKYDGDRYDYDIFVYDPNFPENPQHLYVWPEGREEENVYCPQYGGAFVRYYRPAKEVYNANLTYPVPAVKQLRIETTGGFTVTNGSNTATIQDGAISQGAVAAAYGAAVEGDLDVYVEQEYGSDVTDIVISNLSNEPLTIERLDGGDTYTSIQTSDSFVAASGGVTEFTLNTDGTVSAKTDGTEGTVAVAEDKTIGELFGTTVTTKARELTITPKASGANVKTSEGTAEILISGATEGVTFTDIDATDGVDITASGNTATVMKDGKEIAKGTADENGGSSEIVDEPDPEPDPEPEPDPGIVDGEELLLEIPKTNYYLGDGNKVYHGKIESATESGYTYKTLNNYKGISRLSPVGYWLDDFDNDGEKELLSVYISITDRKAQLLVQKVVEGKVVTKAMQDFDDLDIILEKADRAWFDVFIIERNGKKYICLESDGVNDFFEESRTSQFLMVSYDPDKSGIKKFTEVISHSDEVDYYYDGMGDEIQNQLRNYGIYINGDSYVSGGCRVIDFVNNKEVVCGARTLPTHPAVTVEYGARTNYYLDLDAVKAGDEFTSISFFNTNDLSERNDPGYLYRMYNRLTGEHFYTTNREEKMYLMQIGWSYEGILCEVPEKSNTPVYRLYNPNSGEHHYTPAVSEKNMLVGVGWRYEGIGWYSDDSKKIPIHRLYNPNAVGIYEAGSHHYTSDESEASYLDSIGWRREGEGWYGSSEVAAFY